MCQNPGTPTPTPLGALGAGAHFLLSPPRHIPLVPAKPGPSRRTSTPGSPEAEPANRTRRSSCGAWALTDE